MKPPPLILRPAAFVVAAPAVMALGNKGIEQTMPSTAKATIQLRTQSMLDYLVSTLRKTW